MISICIPVYGQLDLLEECLTALPEAFPDTPYKVYIYDNASPEDRKDLRTFYQKFPVNVTYSPQNKGFVFACNALVKKSKPSKSKFLFFLNSDVVMGKGSGEQLIKNFEESDIGIAGMKLLFADNRHARPFITDVEGKVQHVGLSFNINAQPNHIFIGWSSDNPKVMGMRDVPAVTGAALMIKRKTFNTVGGFDPAFGRGTFEDVDLCMKVSQLGFRIVVDTASTGKHYTNASIVKDSNVGFPLEVNRNLFYNKWKDTNLIQWTDGLLL